MSFSIIREVFLGNVYALRDFNEQFSTKADEHDEERYQNYWGIVAEALGIKEQFEEALKESADASTEKTAMPENDEDFDEEELEEKLQKLISERITDPDFAVKLRTLPKRLRKFHPVQGFLLRRGTLVNLASTFESLIADIIKKYYQLYPSALPSDSRVLSLADLREIGSIENAENYLTHLTQYGCAN